MKKFKITFHAVAFNLMAADLEEATNKAIDKLASTYKYGYIPKSTRDQFLKVELLNKV